MSRYLMGVLLLAGCGGSETTDGATKDGATEAEPTPEALPVFSLAWSEYPSWSTFGVAHEVGLVNGKEGEVGEIEKKWGVDIVLKEADYDSCITMYGAGQVDAAALTNMDSLPPSISKKTVGILPTSTSVGADALITTKDITEPAMLKGKKVYGLELTVSQYTFERNLELKGENLEEYSFSNMDPSAAAVAMQQKQEGYEAIVVWNPFVLETLNKRDDVHVLFDSSTIKGEIIDMVVMSDDSLKKEGGAAFAHAVIDTFYAINDRIADEKTSDDTLVALGEKFSHLDLESMKKVVEQTQFYKTPEAGIALFEGEEVKTVMEKVVAFEKRHEMLSEEPKLGYGAGGDNHFTFDASFMKAVKEKR